MTNRPRRKSDAARRANQVIRGRTMLIMLLLGVATFTVLFWKLYDLQINRHDELKAEAVSQQTDSRAISASFSSGFLICPGFSIPNCRASSRN